MDKYMKLDILGKGCKSNSVYLVKNLENNKLYALKRIIIDLNNEEQNNINNNEGLTHSNIVQYYESFIHKDKLCIVMEYADGGDLGAIIRTHKESKKQIEEEAIWNWLLQVCSAIKYLHSKKILHRDIKAQNIFLTKTNQVKLGDFGISKLLADTMDFAKTSLGTPYFLSPEICSGCKYSFKTDIWMIGCVLYELMALRKPFEGDNFHKLILNILNLEVLPVPKNYSESLRELVSLLLKKDPNSRPSITDILNLDYIAEKMQSMTILSTPSDKYSLKYSSHGSNSSPMNYNSLSTSTLSPVNEADANFYLFNLKFDNLLKGIDEEDEEGSMSPKNIFISEKSIKAPSYKISEFNNILKNLNIPKRKEVELRPNNKSVSYESPAKMTQHNRNRSVNIDNSVINEFRAGKGTVLSSKNSTYKQLISTPIKNNFNTSYSTKNKSIYPSNKKSTKLYELNVSSASENSDFKLNRKPSYTLIDLVSLYGKETVDDLLKLVEKDPKRTLAGDGLEIQKLVGKEYKQVQTILVNIMKSK